jgi:hypothetical protein
MSYFARSGPLQLGFSASQVAFRLRDQSIGMSFVNGNAQAALTAEERASGESNYLLGSDSSQWKTHIPQYRRVRYADVYRGVDLAFYGNGEKLEHDFIVQPGADYRQIRIRYDGADGLTLSSNGDLHVKAGGSEMLVRAPHIYQQDGDHQIERDGKYILLSKSEVGFEVATFDSSLALVIDPVLDYSTYLADVTLGVAGIAVDAAGNTYITGEVEGSGYPVTTGANNCNNCSFTSSDVFITKLNPAGTAQVYSTVIGGTQMDQAHQIAVDSNGNAIITVYSWSSDFPVQNSISSGSPTGSDGFILSLAPDGGSLNFSSRMGGKDSDGTAGPTFPNGLALDDQNDIYVTGTTESPIFPVTAGALHAIDVSYNHRGVFIMKLQASGALAFSGIVGDTGSGSGLIGPVGLALDSAGSIYIAGNAGTTVFTTTVPWPTTAGVYQSASANTTGGPFVAKIASDGSAFVWSTLLGTGALQGMTLTPDNQVIVVGNYLSIPATTDAFDFSSATSSIAKVSADGKQVLYSSYFGIPGIDHSDAIITNTTIDKGGNVWVGGYTGLGANVPLVNPLQSVPAYVDTFSGSAFVSEFDPQLHSLLFSTFFNGPEAGGSVNGIAFDAQNKTHIAGIGRGDTPTTPSSYLPSIPKPSMVGNFNYANRGFAAVIDPAIPGPGICFNKPGARAQVGSTGHALLTVTNCGNAPLSITDVQLSSTIFALPSGSNCVVSIDPGASCSIDIDFTPVVGGTFSASLVVRSNATVPVYDVAVSGVATAPEISPAPSSINFAPQVLDSSESGVSSTLILFNRGTAPLTIDGSSLSTTGDFQILQNRCTSPVSASQACTITVGFQPTALGTRPGTLSVHSNDPVNPTITIPIAGTAIAAYTTPTITALMNPAVALGSTAAGIRVWGTNFFPTSYVVINGEPHPTTFQSSSSLQVNVDPSLLSMVGELAVTVVNPSPGGESAPYSLSVYQPVAVPGAADLVSNPVTHMLYASISATATANPNTVVPVDPLTGKVGTPIPVGTNPRRLALSDDGTYLYVALDGDHKIQRINLSTSQIERTLPLPSDPSFGSTTVYQMHVVPGTPTSLVASLFRSASPGEAGAALFTDSRLASYLTNTYENRNYAPDSFTFTSDPTKFYSYPFGSTFFGVTAVGSNSLSIAAQGGYGCCDSTTGSIVVSDGTLLYTNSGQVWDPKTSTLLGTYPGSSYQPSLVADAALKRTFIGDNFKGYQNYGGFVNILSFDPSNFTQAGIVTLPGYSIQNLSRWGADGFAFLSTDAVVLLRSGIAHTAAGGTPAVSFLAPTAVAGGPTFQLTVNGNGFLPGSEVLWNGSPRATTYVSPTQLIALVPSTDISTVASVSITVVNLGGNTSGAAAYNVTAAGSHAPQTINFVAPASPVVFGAAPITLSAAASSGLPVVFTTTGPATVAGTTLSLTGPGNVIVTASQPGDDDFAAATPVSWTIVVAQTGAAISLTSSTNPALAQSSITFTVVVSSALGTPTGTVTFFDGTTVLANVALAGGTASYSTSTLAAGAHPITAAYSGDANFGQVTSAVLAETVEDLGFTPSSSSGASTTQTVSPGGTATYELTLTPTGSATFPSAVSLSVSGLPAGATYTLTPDSIAAGAPATNVTLSVKLPVTSALTHRETLLGSPFASLALGMLILPLSLRSRKFSIKTLGIFVLLLAATINLGGCSSGASSNASPGPPAATPQNYTITLTATSGSLVRTMNLTLTVK